MPFSFGLQRRSRLLSGGRLWKRLAIATNWPVLAAVAVLALVGVLTIHHYGQSVGSPMLARLGQTQIKYLGIALCCMVAFQAFNYQIIGRFAWVFYLASFVPLLYTVLGASIEGQNPLPGVYRLNGAYNWIRIGGMSIQPAEIMKVAFIMALARYLRYRENYRTVFGLLPPFALCVAPVVLILKQPDLGTALVFGPTLLAMLFVAGARMKHLYLILLTGLLMAPVAWLSGQEGVPVFQHFPTLIKKYQRDRILSMFADDTRTRQGIGFQQFQALTAFGSGGLTGKGVGVLPVGKDVPEGQNDMIFALIGEQFGFIGCVVVVIAYCVLFAAGVEIAAATREPFGRLVAVGVVAILASQTFLNIAVSIKLMPVTGVTLPFISAGGSSLIASFMAAGLLLNIGQHRPLVMAEDSFEFGDRT
jgi:rod shape determining protein RodA